MALTKQARRQRIKYRIRKRISGTPERPRMAVYRSNKQIYVQLIDDTTGITLTRHPPRCIPGRTDQRQNTCQAAALVGKLAAERAAEKGISLVSFDRGGYLYHGRVKSLADAARKAVLNSNYGYSKHKSKKVKATDLELKDRLVAIQRVTKVTKGGRHFSFAAIVVVSDERVVGYGLGKAGEVTSAISKGIEDAKRIFTAYPSAGDHPSRDGGKIRRSACVMKPAAPDPGDCRRCHACGV